MQPDHNIVTGVTHTFAPVDSVKTTIPGDLEAVAIRVKQLHELYDELDQRVSAVLRPEGEDIAGQLQQARGERSQISDQLTEVQDSLDAFTRRLRTLIARIEL